MGSGALAGKLGRGCPACLRSTTILSASSSRLVGSRTVKRVPELHEDASNELRAAFRQQIQQPTRLATDKVDFKWNEYQQVEFAGSSRPHGR